MVDWPRRKVEQPVEIVFDQEKFERIRAQVHELLGEISNATESLNKATQDLNRARKSVEAATERLNQAKRRPTIRRD
jgi:exonuclease VII small subunit